MPPTRPTIRPVQTLALVGALLAALPLAIALAAQHLAGLVPCALCLVERWPYRVAIVLGLAAALLPRRAAAALLALMVVALLAGACIGFVHVGVEQGWWPSPLPECAAPTLHFASIAQQLASMPARPSKPCDSPTYLVPMLPLSMAMLNFLYSAALALLLATLLRRTLTWTS